MEHTLKVEGMSCHHCVNAIEESVGQLAGVNNVAVDLKNGTVAVDYNETAVNLETIKKEIEEQGYEL